MAITKKILSVFLFLTLVFTSFTFIGNAATKSDYDVTLSFSEIEDQGNILDVTVTVENITYAPFDAGSGIFGVSIFLYYDCDLLTPLTDTFSAVAPSGWDSFDGTATAGVWAMHTIFDGTLTNGAVNDGDVSFTVSFQIDKNAKPQDTYLTVENCEGTEYNEKSLVLLKSFSSTAYCQEKLTITEPRILIPHEEGTFTIDRENAIIYSEIPSLDYKAFESLFSRVGGEMTITAFDYGVTAENGKYIPNGAKISVYHEGTGRTFTYDYYLLGDCDCNGTVNSSDLAAIKYTIINKIPTDSHIKYSMDFEADGVIRVADYLRLKLYIINK